MNNIETAKSLLTGNTTCVLVNGEKILTSTESGIKPMLNFIDSGVDLKGFTVADRIVGKAAALLFIYAGITEVFAETLSEPALKLLAKNNIPVSYNVLTERIINRAKTGLCPMEETVIDTENPVEALKLLKAKVESLKNHN